MKIIVKRGLRRINIFTRKIYVTICRYQHDVSVDKAKGRSFPHLRGNILPSMDNSAFGWGAHINWFGVRVGLSETTEIVRRCWGL